MNNNIQNDFEYNRVIVKNPKTEWWISWPVIIITFILFFPVGILLAWTRHTLNKKAYLYSGNGIIIFGCISLFGAFVFFISSIFNGFKSSTANGIIFYLLIGAIFFAVDRKLKTDTANSRKYISIVIRDRVIDIDNIAAALPTSYENAKRDLQRMLNKGFFPGAYIDEEERQIILPQRHRESSKNKSNNITESVKMQLVKCNGCGAQNSIPAGTIGECEFCGSKLEA